MPINYSKKKVAELEDLLQRRGLQTGGMKIQMISRLVKQDKEDENALKATNYGIQAASQIPSSNGYHQNGVPLTNGYPTGATVTQSSERSHSKYTSGTSANGEMKKRVRKGKTWSEKRASEAREKQVAGVEAAEDDMWKEDQDDLIRSLMAGQSDTSTTHNTQQSNTSPGIIVNLTPNAKRKNASSASTSTASRLHKMAPRKKTLTRPPLIHIDDTPSTMDGDASTSTAKRIPRTWAQIALIGAYFVLCTLFLSALSILVMRVYVEFDGRRSLETIWKKGEDLWGLLLDRVRG